MDSQQGVCLFFQRTGTCKLGETCPLSHVREQRGITTKYDDRIEEEEFYKLLPANKADHLCQLWQSCSDLYKIQTVYDIWLHAQVNRASKVFVILRAILPRTVVAPSSHLMLVAVVTWQHLFWASKTFRVVA